MLKAGLKPLAPYNSSSTPWLCKCLKCGKEVTPNFNSVKSKGSGCKYCAKNAVHPTEALKLMAKAKLKPLEDFPGAGKPWKSKCLNCGKVVSPKYRQVRKTLSGCITCGRARAATKNRTNASEAIAIMRSVGLEPLEPYARGNAPWKSRCLKCKKIVSPHFSLVKARRSGCAFCAGTRVDHQDAEILFTKSKLKPLMPYPGNKIPWRAIHTPCGREVSPTYLALKRGQGPCKYCAGKAVHPDDAQKLFIENDLRPLEPYSGDSKKPWRAIHIPCGNEVSPTYNIIQRQESIGCKTCSDQFVDPEEAYQFFLTKDFQPLVPYPGSAKPWKSIHLVCGSVIQPRYGHIRAGRVGCPICSGHVPITQERAFTFFRENGLEPLEPFKGPHEPWKSIHTKCGRTVSPRWASITQGNGGCGYCSGKKVDPNDLERILKDNEIELIEPYEASHKPLKAIHKKCGRKVSPTYSALRSGQGPCEACAKNMVSEEEAALLLARNNYKPLVKFPGGSKPWLALHTVCGTQVEVVATYLRRGGKGCSTCAGTRPITAAEATKLFKSRGFIPIEKFTGARNPRKSIHRVCGRTVAPTYGAIKSGGGCKYCAIGGINLLAPAYLYLITHQQLNSHKIGIAGFSSSVDRLEMHIRHGWTVFATKNFDTAEEAYELEQRILAWLREDLDLPQYLLPEQMPQAGHTETVSAGEIDLETIWAKVLEIIQNDLRRIQ